MAMNVQARFIGGPWDGKVMTVDFGARIWCVPIPPPMASMTFAEAMRELETHPDDRKLMTCDVAEYRRELLVHEDGSRGLLYRLIP